MDEQIEYNGASDSPDRQNWIVVANPEPAQPKLGTVVDAVVYDQLRRLARRYLKHEVSGHALEPSDLVNEMILRMALSKTPVQFQTPQHFVAVSAVVMRHILIDHARAANVFSRWSRMPLENDLRAETMPLGESISMREVLRRLACAEGRLYRIVVLHAFEGCTFREIAFRLSISTRTAQRGWTSALKRLRTELEGSGKGDV